MNAASHRFQPTFPVLRGWETSIGRNQRFVFFSTIWVVCLIVFPILYLLSQPSGTSEYRFVQEILYFHVPPIVVLELMLWGTLYFWRQLLRDFRPFLGLFILRAFGVATGVAFCVHVSFVVVGMAFLGVVSSVYLVIGGFLYGWTYLIQFYQMRVVAQDEVSIGPFLLGCVSLQVIWIAFFLVNPLMNYSPVLGSAALALLLGGPIFLLINAAWTWDRDVRRLYVNSSVQDLHPGKLRATMKAIGHSKLRRLPPLEEISSIPAPQGMSIVEYMKVVLEDCLTQKEYRFLESVRANVQQVLKESRDSETGKPYEAIDKV